MSLATTVHDLKALVRSDYPAVVIETVEEDRVRRLVAAAASGLGLPHLTQPAVERVDTALVLDQVRATGPLAVARRADIERLRTLAEGRFVPVK